MLVISWCRVEGRMGTQVDYQGLSLRCSDVLRLAGACWRAVVNNSHLAVFPAVHWHIWFVGCMAAAYNQHSSTYCAACSVLHRRQRPSSAVYTCNHCF
jgi:hypothetical protein